MSRPTLSKIRGSAGDTDIWGQFIDGFQNPFKRFEGVKPTPPPEYLNEIISAQQFLLETAITKQNDAATVVDVLLELEKNMRRKSRDDESCGMELLEELDGAWRLIFTTGTIDTQKKIKGRINYFPLKAVQTFDTVNMQLTNGIFLGDFPVIKFFGPFEFDIVSRKLEFDFDVIALGGFEIPLGKGRAAQIGSSTGLGSDNNNKLVESGKKPFFNWISCDEEIATARGGGGGLALWKRESEFEARLGLGKSR